MRRRLTVGFTTTELLIAGALLVILFLLAMPVVKRLREGVHSSRCIQNLRQIGAAGLTYTVEFNGKLPITDWYEPVFENRMWYMRVARYLYPDHRHGEVYDYSAFRCPAVEAVRQRPKYDLYRGANIDYAAIFAAPPEWLLYKPIYISQIDGRRSKIGLFMDGDSDGHGGPYNPTTFGTIVAPALSRHLSQINVFFCDGSVRPVPNCTWEDIYTAP